jgi:hypothetical protein
MSDQDVDRPTPALPNREANEAAQLAWVSLQRYTGWLGRDVASKRARAAVDALGLILEQRGDPAVTAAAITKVSRAVDGLEAVDLQPLFHNALHALRVALKSQDGER